MSSCTFGIQGWFLNLVIILEEMLELDRLDTRKDDSREDF